MSRRFCFPVLLVVFCCLALEAGPGPSGFLASRNKYFTIYYRIDQLHAAAVLSRESDAFARRFCGELGLVLPADPVPVYLDPGAPGRNEVFPSPRWIAGYYEPTTGRIVLKTVHGPGRFLEDELVTVFQHEAVHAILHRNRLHLPRWLEEGIAQTWSRGFTFSDGRRLLGINRNRVDDLLADTAFQSPETARWAYPLSAGLVSYLREQGSANLQLLLDRIPERGLDSAFRSVYGADPAWMILLFREDFLARYTLPHLLISDGGTFLLIAIFAVLVLILRRIQSHRRLTAMAQQEETEATESLPGDEHLDGLEPEDPSDDRHIPGNS